MSDDCVSLNTQHLLYSVVCYISGVSDIIVIVLCLLPKVMESLTKKIIISIAVNNLLNNLSFLVSIHSTGGFCIFISYFKSTLLTSGVIWASLISKILYELLVKESQPKPYLFKLSCFICYVIIPILFLLPFTTSSYSDIDYYCVGIENNLHGIIWRFVLVYIPCFLIIFQVIFYYFRIYKILKKSDSFTPLSFLMNRGLTYSFIFLIAFFLLSLARIIQLLNPDCTSTILVVIGVTLIDLQGFFNVCITISRPDVRKSLRKSKVYRERVISDGVYIEQILCTSPK